MPTEDLNDLLMNQFVDEYLTTAARADLDEMGSRCRRLLASDGRPKSKGKKKVRHAELGSIEIVASKTVFTVLGTIDPDRPRQEIYREVRGKIDGFRLSKIRALLPQLRQMMLLDDIADA